MLATHVKNVEGKWKGYLLDGIINEDEPIKRGMDWYTERGTIGSLFNCGYGVKGVNVREEVLTVGLEAMEYVHARTGEMKHVYSVMCYFATKRILKGMELLVDLGRDHHKWYFVHWVATRKKLPPYPERPPVREEGWYDVYRPEQILAARNARNSRGERRFQAGAAAAAAPAPHSDDDAEPEDEDHPPPPDAAPAQELLAAGRRSARQPVAVVRYADEEQLHVTVKRKKEQYVWEREVGPASGEPDSVVLDRYLD